MTARIILCAVVCVSVAQTAPQKIVEFAIQEDAGIDRNRVLVEQGVPIQAMTRSAVSTLAVADATGLPVTAVIEPEGTDARGLVRWLRVSLPVSLQPWQQRRFTLQASTWSNASPSLNVTTGDAISVSGPGYAASFTPGGAMQIRAGSQTVFDGVVRCQIYPDARSIINAGGKTTVLSQFMPGSWTVERPSPTRAVVTLTGRYPKQRSYSSGPGQLDGKLGYDVELRFHFSALSSAVAYDWRLINRAGYKSWLERYALILPLLASARVVDSERSPAEMLGGWADIEAGGAKFGITAPFSGDFGPGTGMRLDAGGLSVGGLALPPDGSLGVQTPQIHRLFYHGMSRTFSGVINLAGNARSVLPMHMRLPAQYYSDTGILPERGDPIYSGEFSDAVERSARWLLENQWRGTIWAGEWWREWDVARRQGTEEASNGNSVLAPLYHYFRTGDRRFLDSASLSAWYLYDVQHDKKTTGFGSMLHTRRHLLDEADWIHPRYQRAFGGILASHLLLAGRERKELIETVRHFSQQIQDASGVPNDWDERKNQRDGETGVDTTNFIEALIACWQETADPFFLDRARGYTRWALNKWTARTDDKQWNWNLTRYVTTGLLAICRAAIEYPGSVPEQKEFLAGTIAISRHTVEHPELGFVPGTIGDGGLHYYFYHAWLDAEVSRLSNDPSLLPPLAEAVRKQMARQDASGAFPMDTGSLWSQYPTQIISYYDPKAVVAYLPVLSARRAALEAAHRTQAVPASR